MGPRHEDEAPRIYSDIVEFACDLDRTYFEGSPTSGSYVRRYVPGEFWPLDAHVDRALVDDVERTERAPLLMHVVAIGVGKRLRHPLFDLEALDRLGAAIGRQQ